MEEMLFLLTMYEGMSLAELAEYARNTVLAYSKGNITKAEFLIKMQFLTNTIALQYTQSR